MPTSEITPVTILYIHLPQHGHTMVTDIRPFQTLALKIQGQGQGYDQRVMSHDQPSIQLICFLFISQSDQQFLRHNDFKIWPWKIQGQG